MSTHARRPGLLGRISLAIIVVALGLIVAVPSLRRVVVPASSPDLQELDYFAEAERRPHDPEAWLAVFSGAARIWSSDEQIDKDRARARERLIELRPESAAPYLLDGVRGVPLERAEIDAWIGDSLPGHTPTEERPLTASERDRLEVLWQGLQRARELDPGNAAIDYLLAYLALADHRDEEADDILRTALRKEGWELYHQQTAIAAYAVALRRGPPELAAVAALSPRFAPHLDFIHLSRVLAGMAMLAAQRGDHAEAVFLYESALRLGQQMVRGSHDIQGVMMGLIAWSNVAGRAPSMSGEGSEETGRPRGEDASSDESPPTGEERFSHTKSCQALVSYLRAHGASDLADEVLDFSRTADEAQRDIIAWIAMDRAAIMRADAPMYRVEQSKIAVAGGLGAVVLCGLVWLVLGLLGRPVAPVRWSRLGWAGLVMLPLFAVIRIGFSGDPGVHTINRPPVDAFLDFRGWTVSPLGESFLLVGLPLILGGVLLVVAAVRRRHPGRHSVGPVGNYVGTAIAVLLPLAALLCLLLLGTTVAAARGVGMEIRDYEAIIEQGELAYYGIEIK